MAVDMDAIDDLELFLAPLAGWADDRNLIAGLFECSCLLPHPAVEGGRQVFNDDQYPARPTCARRTGRPI